MAAAPMNPSSPVTAAGEPFSVAMPAYLSRHDIVYLSPAYEGCEGLPLGNGDLGAMVWFTRTGLRLQLNKSDLWDPANAETPCRTLRAAAQLELDLGAPCLDWLYLTDFEARLSLGRGELTMRAATPFAAVDLTVRIDANAPVLVIEGSMAGQGELAAGAAATLRLERWGSRAFPGWYAALNRDPALGLGQAEVRPEAQGLGLDERFGELRLAVAARLLDPAAQARRVSKHRGEISLPARPVQVLDAVLAAVTSEDSADPGTSAREHLDALAGQAVAARQRHHEWWARFWDRSFVHVPDDYLENLYYLKRYLMASGSRGRYPLVFNGGLWVWHADVRNWVAPHHWNMQQAYWGLGPQGDADLLRPYLDAYWRNRPAARALAEERGAKDALMWSEAHDYHGSMPYRDRPDMVNNFTPASQIASLFWEYCRYTGDREFLESTALPFMREVVAFYAQKLHWEEASGTYGLFPSQSYECPETNQLRNPVTDRVMLESLLRNCLEATRVLGHGGPETARWQHLLDHLWPLETADYPGIGPVLVEAWTPTGQVWWRHGMQGLDYHFSPQSAVVFPAGLIDVTQVESAVGVAVCNYLAHHPAEKNSITPDPIVAARLGLGDRALTMLRQSVRRLQHFPQGLFYNLDHWHLQSPHLERLADPALVAQRDYVYDRRARYDGPGLPAWPFVQCGLEPLGVLGAAVNEMLLHSHAGVIRLFPGVPADWECAFTLWAQGGVRVSARRDADGTVGPVCIRRSRDGVCRVAHPWPGAALQVTTGDGEPVAGADVAAETIEFTARAAVDYYLSPVGVEYQPAPCWRSEPNAAPKQFHEAILGRRRDF